LRDIATCYLGARKATGCSKTEFSPAHFAAAAFKSGSILPTASWTIKRSSSATRAAIGSVSRACALSPSSGRGSSQRDGACLVTGIRGSAGL